MKIFIENYSKKFKKGGLKERSAKKSHFKTYDKN